MFRLILALMLILSATIADAGWFFNRRPFFPRRPRQVYVSKQYTCEGGRCRVEYSKSVNLGEPPMSHDEWLKRQKAKVHPGVIPETDTTAPTADPPKKPDMRIDVEVNPFE